MFKFLSQRDAAQDQSELPSLEQAAAMLLLETAHADGSIDPTEVDSLRRALRSTFGLNTEAVEELLNSAQQRLQTSDGVYVFARRLREAWSAAQRRQLLVSLWQVVYADGRVDRYEESHLRQVADLLGLTHAEYIQAKHVAETAATQ